MEKELIGNESFEVLMCEILESAETPCSATAAPSNGHGDHAGKLLIDIIAPVLTSPYLELIKHQCVRAI
jgi:hypothetical protein